MLGKVRDRLTYANVMATIAVFLALGGGTTAVALQGRNTVDSGDIINQEVKTPDVRNDNLRSVDIRDGTLEAIDVAFGTLRGDEIQDGTLSSSDVADDSLSGSDIDESSLAQVPSAGSADTVANGSVKAGSLGTITQRLSMVAVPGGVAGNGTYAVSSVAAACNPGELALSGGVEWDISPATNDDELPIIEATMFAGNVNNKPDRFIAAGGNDTSTERTLVATVFCLAP